MEEYEKMPAALSGADVVRQNAEYLDGFREALEDIFSRTAYQGEPSESPVEWAGRITDLLQDAGWRMVTAKDWKEMSEAWMFTRLR